MAAAATLALQYADATSQAFINRVLMALATTAAQVASEWNGTGNPPANHANRIAYAKTFYGDPVGTAVKAAFSFATQIGAGDTDPTAFTGAASALWNDLAGNF